MARKLFMGAVVVALVLVGLAPAAGASTTIPLLVPQSTAFAVLGHSCGGIQEQAFATGFDAVSGDPVGAVYLQTRCGGSGRGGGYQTTTYAAWVGATWDFAGTVVASATLAAAPPNLDPSLVAFDAFGNEVYNTLSSVNVLPANCTVGNTTYCAYRAYLVVQSTFVAAPTVTGVLLSSGPSGGGTTVTITGTALTGATAVDFGTTPAASFVVNGDTSITAVSPAASAGTVDVTVTTAGGTSAAGSADQFTFVDPPVVSAVSPATGPLAGGTPVTITGTALTGATAVWFGTNAASFVVNSDTSITAVSPVDDAADTVDVTVASAGGTSATSPADQFTYTTAPSCSGSCVSIGDAAILEGDAGAKTLLFAVTLSHPSATTVKVQYATEDGTATGAAAPGLDVDYRTRTGTLTFAPSATTGVSPVVRWVTVPVYGDTTFEQDETFSVMLSNPSPGTTLGRSAGTGTIVNDDGVASGITAGIGDASIVQTAAGNAKLSFPVTLSAPAATAATFTYSVSPDTATYSPIPTAGADFGGRTSGKLTFLPGSSTRRITVLIWPDPNPDVDQGFTITITALNAPSVTVVRAEGTGTIFGS